MSALPAPIPQPTYGEIIRPAQDSPYSLFTPGEYGVLFGTEDTDRRRRLDWIATLPDEQKRQEINGRQWLIRGDAFLPDGRRLQDALRPILNFGALPDELKGKKPATIAKYNAAVTVVRKIDELLELHPHMLGRGDHPVSKKLAAKVSRLMADTIGRFKLPTSTKRLGEMYQDVKAGRPIDRRYNAGRPEKPKDATLVEIVRETFLNPNQFKATQAFARQSRKAQEMELQGELVAALTPWQVRTIIEELPMAAKVAAREGRLAMKRKCLPHARMDYSHIPPEDWMCFDGSDADAYCRVPDGKGGWKPIKAVWIGAVSLSSEKAFVEVSRSENASAISRLVRHILVESGRFKKATKDWGKAFGKVLGLRGKTIMNTLERRMKAEPHQVGVKDPESKKIESIWRHLRKEGCDRWHAHFAGGSPGERPHDVIDKIKQDVLALPTFEEYGEHVRLAVQRWNATPRETLGGLSPNLYHEQHRVEDSRMDWEKATLLCTPAEITRTAHRDGISVNNLLYRLETEDQLELQGKIVKVGRDLDQAGVIWIFDANDRPICCAVEDQLVKYGVTTEQQKNNARSRAKMRRIVREYLPARNFLDATPTRQLLQELVDEAQSKEAEVAATLPPAPRVQRVIVRPDFSEAGREISKREKTRKIKELAQVGIRTAETDDVVPEDLSMLSLANDEAPASEETIDFERISLATGEDETGLPPLMPWDLEPQSDDEWRRSNAG